MKNFCVYLHLRKDTGEIFYVGSGTNKRPFRYCKYTRSKVWHRTVAEAGGFDAFIILSNLSKEDSLAKEAALIQLLQGIVNCCKPTKVVEIPSKEFLEQFIRYSAVSPSGITDIEGNPLGSKRHGNGKAYWVVYLSGTRYRVHRLVPVLLGQELPRDLVIDHIDGNSLNNTFENLRICTQAENMKNVNTKNSQLQGVHFKERDNIWEARWQEGGKQKTKSFSVKKHGETAKDMAIAHRRVMAA